MKIALNSILFSALIFGFTICVNPIFGQEVIEEQYPEQDTSLPSFGPNFKHFTHLWIDLGFVVGPSGNNAPIIYGNSTHFGIGVRYKRKLNPTFALGVDFNYAYTIFRSKQDTVVKIAPTQLNLEREELVFNDFTLSPFFRVNFDGKKRGEVMGTYLDLGGYFSWMFRSTHIARPRINGVDPNFLSTDQEIRSRGLQYTDDVAYGLKARFGYQKLYLMVDYRLSDRFKTVYGFDEFPQWIVGVGLCSF